MGSQSAEVFSKAVSCDRGKVIWGLFMDIVSREVRSRMMAGIRGSDTLPEMKVRKLLHRQGFRYRLHQRNLPGKPDVVLSRYRVCIFVHGCFWHRHPGCRYATTPKTHEDFWQTKFDQNVKRDLRNRDELLRLGWRVIELWECGIRGPEAEMNWLLETIPDCNQKYVSWPDLSDQPVPSDQLTMT
ncbi:very short patch repair endonuclease [Pseudomonas sp. NY15436]|uniref:very short patch repair endonuclease n=1 Tax=Pseudomonas sp. NY15436 TaxID=3400359 RepID=UPI003A8AFC95